MRRTLRGHGPRAERLVHDVEEEVLDWLVGGTILNPDEAEDVLVIPGRPVGFEGSNIVELSRTPLQLIWSVEQDAFARYIVHCCARYHKVVSYSKFRLNSLIPCFVFFKIDPCMNICSFNFYCIQVKT